MILSPSQTTEQTAAKPKWASQVLFERTFCRFFTFSTTPRRLIGAGLFTALMLALVLVHTDEFLQKGVEQGTLLYALCLVACLILGGITMLRLGIHSQPLAAGISTVIVALLPIVAMTMVECLNDKWIWDWSPQTMMLNYILYMLFYGTVYVCSGSYRLPMLIVNPLFFLLALTNYYVYAFRGTPFIPMDLFSAGTAANVAAAYDFSLTYQIVISIVLLASLLVVGFKLRTPAFELMGKLATRIFFGTLTVCIVCIYIFTDQYAQVGLKPDFWSQSRGYHKTGVVMNFCLNTKYVSLGDPSGYNADQVDDLMAAVLEEDPDSLGANTAPETPSTPPNIICVMNESLADLNVLGDVQTNIDYMPYLRSLTENTIKGNLYVPVIGSGTSNTEFEFLTGVSTRFFPAGSNAYMLYVDEPMPSLVSTLMDQRYSGQAFHPYYASGWNRRAVYNNFGFSRFTSLGSIIPNSILSQYSASGAKTEVLQQLVEEMFPGEDVLLRRYVSDSRNYRQVIKLYEERNQEEPFFLFNVTMQNHGGYTEQTTNFEELVHVTGLPGESATAQAAGIDVTTAYPKANQFLSLMKYSDDAFRELIDYFQQVEEPTIICMFGDHQPNVENAFVQRLLGVDSLYDMALEQEQKRYVTPFYIWANYDIPEQTIDMLSVNYLSSYVLQTAGVEMPAFNRYLLKLSETLPVINNIGHIDAAGNHYAYGVTSPYDDLLKDYQKIAYNYIHDEKNRQDELFYIGG